MPHKIIFVSYFANIFDQFRSVLKHLVNQVHARLLQRTTTTKSIHSNWTESCIFSCFFFHLTHRCPAAFSYSFSFEWKFQSCTFVWIHYLFNSTVGLFARSTCSFSKPPGEKPSFAVRPHAHIFYFIFFTYLRFCSSIRRFIVFHSLLVWLPYRILHPRSLHQLHYYCRCIYAHRNAWCMCFYMIYLWCHAAMTMTMTE